MKGYVEQVYEDSLHENHSICLHTLYQAKDSNITHEPLLCEYQWINEHSGKCHPIHLELKHVHLWVNENEEEVTMSEDPSDDMSQQIERMDPEYKKALMHEIEKVHRGLGHPCQSRFLRVLRAGKASEEVLA